MSTGIYFLIYNSFVFIWAFLLIFAFFKREKRQENYVKPKYSPKIKSVSILIPCGSQHVDKLKEKIKAFNLFESFVKWDIVVVFDSKRPNKQPEFLAGVNTIYTGEWLGKTEAQNIGIKLCKNNVILLNDVDTVVTEYQLLVMLKEFEETKFCGVVTAPIKFLKDIKNTNTLARFVDLYWKCENRLRLILSEVGLLTTAAGPCMLINKNVWPEDGLDSRCGDDCALPLVALGNNYIVLQSKCTPIIDYHYADDSIEQSARKRMAERNVFATIDCIKKYPKLYLYLPIIYSHKLSRWFTGILFILQFPFLVYFYPFPTVASFLIFCSLSFFKLEVFANCIRLLRFNIALSLGTINYLLGNVRNKY